METKFIGRKEELDFLRNRFNSKSYENIVIYGRRRIGKTTLILESVKNLEYFYFIFSQKLYGLELEKFISELSKKFNVYLGSNISSFYELFEICSKKLPHVIFLLDEFTYMIEQDKSFVGEFQKISDQILKPHTMKIVFSGSSVSVMETEVLGYKSPLYGRRTGQIKLKEFSFFEMKYFFPKLSNEVRFKIYSILGGIPFYLEQYNQSKTFEENIKENILNKNVILFEEGEFLLREELREPQVYFRILQHLSYGVGSLNDLSQKSKINSNNIHKYLKRLELLEIIEKSSSMLDNKQKNSRYIIKDNYFRFYFKYIYPNLIDIEQKIYSNILNDLNQNSKIFSLSFEEICRDYASKKRIFNYGIIYGSWWYKSEEIDLLGLNEKIIVFGECKFEKGKMKKEIFEKLLKKKDMVKVPDYQREEKYVLFSKSGFENNLKILQKERNDLLLVEFKEFENI